MTNSAPIASVSSSGPHAERSASSSANDRTVRELMVVREVMQAFLTAERPEEVFQLALDRVGPLVGAAFACVYLIDDGSDLMRLAAVHRWPSRYSRFLREMRIRVGAGPSGEAAQLRRAIEVPDVFADRRLEDWREIAGELGFRSLVALPLERGTTVRGAATFYFAEAGATSAETHQLLRVVADQMMATTEKARLIDDLRAANTALERRNAELMEARRIKDEFLSNISHELRTPLTAVIGYIALMQEGLSGPVTEEQQSTLGQVKNASERLLSLIGDLLDLTALKRGAVPLEIGELDPRDPLRDAVQALGDRTSGVALVVTEPDLLPRMTSGRRAIAKALGALLENAFKFTHDGEVRATVTVDGGRVRYTVADTGIGIPLEAQRFVFDEFRQADGSATRRYGGAGLGLALARKLARRLHGDITLVSAPGAGSTFTLDVPLEVAVEPGEERT